VVVSSATPPDRIATWRRPRTSASDNALSKQCRDLWLSLAASTGFGATPHHTAVSSVHIDSGSGATPDHQRGASCRPEAKRILATLSARPKLSAVHRSRASLFQRLKIARLPVELCTLKKRVKTFFHGTTQTAAGLAAT
jgi:hypothetical protein